MGKIVKLILSADSCVCSGRVKLHTGRIIGRPLKLLFPLEVSVSGEQTRYDEHNTSVENTKQDRRPIRKAAIQAKAKLKELMKHYYYSHALGIICLTFDTDLPIVQHLYM